MAEHDELVRKSVGRRRNLSVFEQIRRVNANYNSLGIQPPTEDHLVRKSVGRPRGGKR
jgi:hypothetical protein